VRANTRARRDALREQVNSCFEAGATATRATLKITEEMTYDDHIPNFALGRCYRTHLNNLDGEWKIPGLETDIVEGRSGASTDQGNVSYALPSLHTGFGITCETGAHNPVFTVAARTRDAHERALRVGKALAATAVDVLTREGLLKKVKDDFEEAVKSSRNSTAL
jgi:metal-dependent amidase/aminoacylase/carboxypeptidase family protein